MKIGLDVMGGDFAPDATIDGAILAREALDAQDEIVLIGQTEVIKTYLEKINVSADSFAIVNAEEIIGMAEKPLKALTNKPDSSISSGFRLLKSRQIQGFCSAGNSGAMVVGAMYSVGTIAGVIRPTTIAHIPQENGAESIILDIGTNPDTKADVLYQFALLGSIYCQEILKIKNPRVGLLNIGAEEGKGNLLCQSAYLMMKDTTDFNFTGNVESRDLFKGKVDVVVCDGFTGNIVLKQIEAMYRLLQKRKLTDDYINRFNYENYGGSPVLGANGNVVIGHGISSAIAIKNMIVLTRQIYCGKVTNKIRRALHNFSH
ncbi:MAG: phosphate acyltransferase PlsX [Clostridia bacterium]|nr:phosphate acyltransferase PlsX [Clostridia bacterium]